MSGETSLEYRQSAAESRERAASRLSASFLLDEIAQGLGPLSTREALLVFAINQANIAPLTRDPEARRRYGALEAPAPDHERRPVSVSAVANSLGLPFETVRRQVRGLETLGVCIASPQGVIVPQAFLGSPAYLESVRRGCERLRLFYLELRAADLLGPQPAPAFATPDGAPLRGAARLLSDYMLRAGERLRARAGDLVSALVLLAVLETSLQQPRGVPRSVASIARRLGVPEETARRHAGRLAEQGLCRRTPRGLMCTELDAPGVSTLLRDNAADVQRLFAALAERGVLAAWS